SRTEGMAPRAPNPRAPCETGDVLPRQPAAAGDQPVERGQERVGEQQADAAHRAERKPQANEPADQQDDAGEHDRRRPPEPGALPPRVLRIGRGVVRGPGHEQREGVPGDETTERESGTRRHRRDYNGRRPYRRARARFSSRLRSRTTGPSIRKETIPPHTTR